MTIGLFNYIDNFLKLSKFIDLVFILEFETFKEHNQGIRASNQVHYYHFKIKKSIDTSSHLTAELLRILEVMHCPTIQYFFQGLSCSINAVRPSSYKSSALLPPLDLGIHRYLFRFDSRPSNVF